MKLFGLPLSSQHLIALVLTAPLAMGIAEARSASPVPFASTFTITETIEMVGSAPCFLVGDITGQGIATHLGALTLVSQDCINPISQTEPPTEFSFSSNQMVLTAANGNKLFVSYSGTFTTDGTVGIINGGYQITGGTGRFSKATGAGKVLGLEDMTTGKGQVTLTGTIS
jgi:hypothetical protein